MKIQAGFLTAGALALVLSAPLFAQGGSSSMDSDTGSSGQYSSGSGGISGGGAGGSIGGSAQSKAPDMSSSYKASDLMNKKVTNNQGQELGQVSEVIIGNDGNVSHVVLSQAGDQAVGGGSKYAVPWDRLSLAPGQGDISLDVSRDNLSTEFSAFEEGSSGSMGGSSSGGGSAGSGGSLGSPSDSSDMGSSSTSQ